MRSILDELFYGNICPDTDCRIRDEETKQLIKYVVDHHEKLQATLTDEQKEILEKFAGRVIMNIHVKIWDHEQLDEKIEEIAALLEKYDCVRHAYFMSTNTEALLRMRERLPAAGYCQGAGDGHENMVAAAIEHKLDKVQFVYWYPLEKEMVDRCHAHGIICNFCQADTAEDARRVLGLGVDTILTNDYLTVKNALDL